MYSSLLELIIDLKEDDNGSIKDSLSNISIIERRVNQVFTSQLAHTKIGKVIVNGVRKLLGLNRIYFKTVGDYAVDTIHEQAVKRVLKRLGYNTSSDKIIKGSWLDELASNNRVKQQVLARLYGALSSNITKSEFKKQFRDDFLDTQSGLGLVVKDMDFHAGNIFRSIDRQTQLLYADKLKVEYFMYSGTIKDNTRDFCRERVNRIYTKKEIQRWNSLNWKGKIKGSDVFTTLGGYSCRHTLHAMSEEVALATAKRLGRPIDTFN